MKIIKNENWDWLNSETCHLQISIMIATSPKSSSFAKLGLGKQRPLRVMVVGQVGVGKTGKLKFILPLLFLIDCRRCISRYNRKGFL